MCVLARVRTLRSDHGCACELGTLLSVVANAVEFSFRHDCHKSRIPTILSIFSVLCSALCKDILCCAALCGLYVYWHVLTMFL